MCRIKLNINFQQGTTPVTSATGRYKKISEAATAYKNFSIDMNNPLTPDITSTGEYNLEVQLTDAATTTNWFTAPHFTIADCAAESHPISIIRGNCDAQDGETRTLFANKAILEEGTQLFADNALKTAVTDGTAIPYLYTGGATAPFDFTLSKEGIVNTIKVCK